MGHENASVLLTPKDKFEMLMDSVKAKIKEIDLFNCTSLEASIIIDIKEKAKHVARKIWKHL